MIYLFFLFSSGLSLFQKSFYFRLVLNFMTIYFYHIIKKIIYKKIIKLNRIYDTIFLRTKIDLICHCLNSFHEKNYHYKVLLKVK
jgi:hypothetical protein